jgi:hypothetical protein
MKKLPLLLVLVACGGETKPPANNPDPAPTASSTEATPAPTATTAETTPAPTATTPPEPPKPVVKVSFADVTKIEVMVGTKKKDITKEATVQQIAKAVGSDQVADGAQRKCPDDVTLNLKDKAGADKGKIGFCNVEGLGAEYSAAGSSERHGFKVADEPGVRKALDIKAPKAAPAPKPTTTAAPKPATTAAPKK